MGDQFKKLSFLLVLILAVAAFGFFVKMPAKPPSNTGIAILSWDVNAESDLAGYKIYYGTLSRTNKCPPAGYSQKVDVGNKISYTIDKLEIGKTYYFSITSYDTSGNESCFSDEMSKAIIN